MMRLIHFYRCCQLILILQLFQTGHAVAEQIQENLPDGRPVNAEYLPTSNTHKPAIIVLHGFLQTYNFLATQNIVSDLSAQDYTVLAPNLSLGVPDRKQSVQCNAAHTHTAEGDLKEIDFWIKWLKNKGHNSIILVGHSWGSQHSLAYKLDNPNSPVTAIIAISLVRTHQGTKLQKRQIQLAKSRLQKDKKALHAYQLGFCKEYISTAESYISYAKWNDRHVINTLARLKERKLPMYVILGAKDMRIDPAWAKSIEKNVKKMIIIEGANHFFSHISEFDLNDQLKSILSEMAK